PLGQAALLAGLPQNPNRFRPDRRADRARFRRDIVLGRMLALRMITRPDHDQALAEPVEAAAHALPQNSEDHEDDAFGAMPTLIGLTGRTADSVLPTTLDASVQRQSHAAAKRALANLSPSGVGAIAVVVLDTRSGECRAAVSLARERTDLDLTARLRSTGSVLKPFIYAAAFEQRICAPDTVLCDQPHAWGDFVPRNFDKDFHGALTAATALAESRNLPALQLLSK